jgi:hypothetical protein
MRLPWLLITQEREEAKGLVDLAEFLTLLRLRVAWKNNARNR